MLVHEVIKLSENNDLSIFSYFNFHSILGQKKGPIILTQHILWYCILLIYFLLLVFNMHKSFFDILK